MTDDRRDVERPEGFGIQNPLAPGEPDYWSHEPAEPVPATAKKTRDRRRNTRDDHTPKGAKLVAERLAGRAPKTDEWE